MSQPDVDVFRADVRAWLASNYTPRTESSIPDGFAVFQDLTEEEEHDLLEKVRDYRQKRFDAGYGALTLAAEHGGAGYPAEYAVAYTAEEQAFEVPTSTELISVTTGLVGPAISVFGTDEQRERFAKAFLRTDMLCCQLFSEPGAGSDLAAAATRAVRDGDEWVIDGQKVWSSGARHADWGFLLARTDPEVVKQAGLTMFLVPMDAPGLEVRPIRQMSGGSSFNEVFFEGVRIPDSLRVGEPGTGWQVANATLGFERTASGQGTRRKGGDVYDVIALAQRLGRTRDPVVRQRLADLYVRSTLRSATTDRVARAAAAGKPPGPAASVGKLVASNNMRLTGELAASLLGGRIAADTGEELAFDWTEHLLGAPGYRLAGGTDEIQRNIIGERVLGLPREPSADKGVPFSQLQRG